MVQIAYYIDEYSDECMPCGTSLDDWAQWLSKPDEDWGRDEAAKDGDTFRAYVYDFHQSVARVVDGDWVLDPPAPVGTEFMALRYGDGMGWHEDMVCSDMDDLAELLAFEDGQGCYIACAVPKPAVQLVYRNGALSPAPLKG